MRLVHISDLHLGFRQYQRLTPGGINQREWDVSRSFQAAVDRMIELRPDMVLVAGDVFHNVRPTNPAIIHAYLQFSRLRAELPNAPIVMIAGGHDIPRASETGSILRLFRELGIHVAYSEPDRFYFGDLGISVLAVPDLPGKIPTLKPDPEARFNVLLLHGAIEGVLPAHFLTADRAALEIPLSELNAASWDYIALGDYHVYRQVKPNAYYSGSIDYTSLNAWGDLTEERLIGVKGKGMIEWNLESGAQKFHVLPPSRSMIDLPPISARGLTVAEVNDRIQSAVNSCPGGIDDKIVRLIVRDLPRHIARDLDHKSLREYKRRALHFHLDARRPEVVRLAGQGAPGRRPSLADVVREKLMSRVLESDIDRKELVALGLRYLSEAENTVGAAPLGGDPIDGSG
ncbi:MAG TPA: DNA repair exonuclease [Gemmatimonadaceae bacterium]|nr:DNA repair exonuclease [Gemmatimonadaceae bacterium]